MSDTWVRIGTNHFKIKRWAILEWEEGRTKKMSNTWTRTHPHINQAGFNFFSLHLGRPRSHFGAVFRWPCQVLAGHKISNRSKVGFADHVCSMKRRKEENKKIQKWKVFPYWWQKCLNKGQIPWMQVNFSDSLTITYFSFLRKAWKQE